MSKFTLYKNIIIFLCGLSRKIPRFAAIMLMTGMGLVARPIAANTLNSGDLAVTGWSALSDTITFVTLTQVPSGTVISLTDKGWNQGTNAFTTTTTGDGTVTWTTSSTIAEGSILQLYLGGSDAATTLTDITTNTDLSADISVSTYTVADPVIISGDGIFIYQDSSANPYFIFGFNNSSGTIDATGWNTVIGATLRDSMLPNGTGSQNSLTNGTNALGITPSQLDNAQYTGPTTNADAATWLARITNISNWSGDNTGTISSSIGTSPGSSININTAPSIALDGGSLSYTENAAITQVSPGATASDSEANWNGGSLAVQIASNATATDALFITSATGLTVSGTNLLDGATVFATLSISGGSVSGSSVLTITFNGSATNARVQNTVRAIGFANSSDNPSTATRTVSFFLADNATTTPTATRNISFTAVNDVPVIIAPGSIGVTEDVASAITGVSFADVDAGSASVTVTLSVGSGTLNATSGGGVTVSGSDTNTMTLSGSIANINTFIAGSNLSFTTASNATSNVTLSVGIDDNGNSGSGGPQSSSTSVLLSVTAVNDAPTITAPGSIGVTEDVASAITGISFTDVDAGSASVTVTLSVDSGTLNATSGGGVTVSGSGTTTLMLSGSIANINTFIAGSNVSFTTASNATSNVNLGVDINDGGNTGAGGAQTNSGATALLVTAVNDYPVVGFSGGTASFVQGNGLGPSTPVAIDSGMTVTDVDNTTFVAATVSISANLVPSEDVLAFTNDGSTMGDIIGSYTAATGVLTLTSASSATRSEWEAALRAVTYTNVASAPNTAIRAIGVRVDDGAGLNPVAIKFLTITLSIDVHVGITNGVTSLNGGQSISYTIEVTNNGPSLASGVVISAIPPSNFTSVLWDCMDSGATCPHASGSGAIAETADLPAAGTLTYIFNGIVEPTPETTLTNTVTVTPPASMHDYSSADNSASDTDPVGVFIDGFE